MKITAIRKTPEDRYFVSIDGVEYQAWFNRPDFDLDAWYIALSPAGRAIAHCVSPSDARAVLKEALADTGLDAESLDLIRGLLKLLSQRVLAVAKNIDQT